MGRLGGYEEAMEALGKAVAIDPYFDEAYYNLAMVYSQLNRNQEAIAILKEAVEENPNFAAGHLGLAWIYQNIGDKESATKEYNTLKGKDQKLAECLLKIINRK